MSRLNVDQILTQIASTVNQEATAPSTGSSEWELWMQYVNRAVFEWANSNDWEVLRKRFFPSITGVSQASVAVPSDFKKIAAAPKLYDGSISTGVEYAEILPEQEDLYASDDKYFKVVGDISSGFSLVFNPSDLSSGASLAIQYFSMPTSLASGSQYPVVPDNQFIVDRVIGYIFEARSDARFQIEEQKARERLLAMIENANASKYSSYANPNFVITPERRAGFRVGRD